MKVTVKKKKDAVVIPIETEFIKLEAAIKLSHAFSGGMAKAIIQEGQVSVNGEICTMRGKKLYPEDKFFLDGQEYMIVSYEAE